METYSMTQVETLTGINAHTLRIWERRYDFMKAQRTDTNIRFYTADQLKTLLNVAILMRSGLKVSKINDLNTAQIIEKVLEIESANSLTQSDDINLLTVSMLTYNEESFQKIFQRCILRYGMVTTITTVIYPFLNHIGILWGTSKISPPQEHFISNLIRQKIISGIDTLPLAPANAPIILFFLLEGEDHELGLLLSNYIAKDLGYKTIYLGQRTPIYTIQEAIEITNPSIIMTLLTTPRSDDYMETFESISESLNKNILIAGSNHFTSDTSNTHFITYLKSPNEFIDILKKQ